MSAILTRTQVAALLGVQPDTVTRYMRRYPKGHEFEFPQPEDPESAFPYWDAARADEVKAWRGPGRGTGGGRPSTRAQVHADDTGDASGTGQAGQVTLPPLRPINRRATRDVFRNLQRPKDQRDPWGSAGEGFDFSSPALYREQAMRWLSDHSALRTRTIESADWSEIYRYFRAQKNGR